MVTVPVEIVISCLTVVPELVKAMLPAFKLPAPTASVFMPEVALGMVMAPETLNAAPELALVTVVLFALAMNVSEAQLAAAVFVIV
jgi:hypothetical protein